MEKLNFIKRLFSGAKKASVDKEESKKLDVGIRPPAEEEKTPHQLINSQERQRIYISKRRAIFDKWCESCKSDEISLSDVPIKRLLISDMPEYRTKSIIKSTDPSKIASFVVIDTETTGLRARADEIIEVSAVKFENYTPVSYVDTLIKPKKPITEEITNINHIANEDVEHSPCISAVIPFLKDYLGSLPLVGHNLPFDIKFLYSSGLDFFDTKRVYYDTLELSKKVYKDVYSYTLESLCKHCGIYPPKSHRAYYDCLATGALFANIVEDITEKFEFYNLFDKLLD